MTNIIMYVMLKAPKPRGTKWVEIDSQGKKIT